MTKSTKSLKMRFVITFFVSMLTITCFNSAFAQTDSDIISEIYANLNRDYINHISNKEISAKGLKALEKVDPKIKISWGSQKVFFYYGSTMAKSMEIPAESASNEQWVKFNQALIDTAIKVSPRAEILDFELPDRFAAAVFKDLDGYSHYYGQFSESETHNYADNPLANKKNLNFLRRNFASRLIDDILLLKILNFETGISQKVLTAVNECSACQGIILDLRGNHGGIFDEALKIANLFLDEGLIAYTFGKNADKPRYYTADVGDVADNKPLVILVDGFTASAAEIIAGALSEQNRAVLIGTKTYGKGTVQDVMKLPDGIAMALTTAYFYTPSGYKIDKAGLKPAICTGGIIDDADLKNASCDQADRFNHEADVTVAVRYLKNEL